MLKVMVVDDEKNVRELIKRLINWENEGFKICTEGIDGIEAVELMKKYNVDLVIADINMPNMNGLEFADYVRINYPDSKVIILTAYDEFEYARQAVNIGVFYFLLKPVDRDELIDIIRKAKKCIESEKKEKEIIRTLESRVKEGSIVMKEKFLNNLLICSDLMNYEEINYKFQEYNIRFSGNTFQVIAIEIDKINELFQNEMEKNNLKQKVLNIINKIVIKRENIYVFQGKDNIIFILISYDCVENHRYIRLINLLNNINIVVKKETGYSITLGCGQVYEGYKNISNSYYEAVYALKYKFIIGTDRVINFNSVEMTNTRKTVFPKINSFQILSKMRSNCFKDINIIINSIYKECISKKITVEYAQIVFSELVILCISYINEKDYDIHDIFGSKFNPLEELKSKETLLDAKNFVIDSYKESIDFINNNNISSSKKIVFDAVNYIEKNISDEDLNVSNIAKKMFVSRDYLTYLFKKEIGVSVIKYLNKCRMETARKYMNDGYTNLENISGKVGFNDANYFSKCFKKYFGISPSKYLIVKNK